MTPILFDKDEREFTSNGLGRLADCRRFEVTEERNGEFVCQFEYPINGPLYDQIAEGCYVYTTCNESKKPQAFIIYHRSAPLEGFVTFDAWHISYLLNQIILRPYSAGSCAAALAAMPANSINYNPFTFWTDKAVNGSFAVNYPKSVRAALGGAAGSILDTYGKGDFEFDMYAVKLHANRGADRGVSIRYGKNLVSLDQQKDASNLYNAVIPYWTANDGEAVVALTYPIFANAPGLEDPITTHTPEAITTHAPEDIIARYPELYTIALDLSSYFQERPTAQQLADKAAEIIEANDNYEVKENITVDFVALWQTEEYKNVASLQRVYLCDTVHVYYSKLGINATAKVIKTVYDSLNERYTSIELGTPKTSLGQQITETITGEIAGEYATRSAMQSAIDKQTEILTGASGGYHVTLFNDQGDITEDLWMDTPDVNTAQNILRINRNGIGFSRTGINGPYFSAWTIDGAFNADFITAGTLSADRIAANSINVSKLAGQIANGTWEIDLDAGTFTIGEIDAGKITSGTLDADRIGAGTIDAGKLNASIITSISNAQAAADDAQDAADAAQAAANGANAREQLIYHSTASTVTAPSGWVSDATGNQNVWTTTRPVYNSAYPTLYIATQRQAVDGTITTTTPRVDNTTTVIDGGHITTGSINANLITAGRLQDTSGLNYWDLSTGQFVTAQGQLGGFTITANGLNYGDITAQGSGGGFALRNDAIYYVNDSAGVRSVATISGTGLNFGNNINISQNIWDWKAGLRLGTITIDGTTRTTFGLWMDQPPAYTGSANIMAWYDNGQRFITDIQGDLIVRNDANVAGNLTISGDIDAANVLLIH